MQPIVAATRSSLLTEQARACDYETSGQIRVFSSIGKSRENTSRPSPASFLLEIAVPVPVWRENDPGQYRVDAPC